MALLKVPEIAVILSVIALGRRLSNYGNPLLGYLLLGVAVLAGIWWIHSLYSHNTRQKVGKYRVDLTWATASVLLTLIIYPCYPQLQRPIQQAAQPISMRTMGPSIPATTLIPQIANAPTQTKQGAIATTAASIIQPPMPTGDTTWMFTANPDTAGNTTIHTTDSTRNTILGSDRLPATLTYSQRGNTVTVKPSRGIELTSLVFVFDVKVSLLSHTLGTCMSCGNGRVKDSHGFPDNKTIWIFWASPPFIPDRPLSMTFSSAAPAKLLKVISGPRPK